MFRSHWLFGLICLLGCDLSVESKDACQSNSDCIGDRICSAGQCVDRSVDAGGSNGDSSDNGTSNTDAGDGTVNDASVDSSVPPTPPADAGCEGECTDAGDECAVNHGGCGDPTYYTCSDTPDAAPVCGDIDECTVDEDACPALCTNNIGAAPTCSEPTAPCGNANIAFGEQGSDVDVTAGYVCCDVLEGNHWKSASVKAKAQCGTYSGGGFGGPSEDQAASSCDGKDDCGDAFCCFTYSTMGPPSSAMPRAHGRRCLSEASCKSLGGVEGQSGFFSCNDVSDCPAGYTQCIPEPKGVTSGEQRGRSWVRVCAP